MPKNFREDIAKTTRPCASCAKQFNAGDKIVIMSELGKSGFDMLCLACGNHLKEGTTNKNTEVLEKILIQLERLNDNLSKQS